MMMKAGRKERPGMMQHGIPAQLRAYRTIRGYNQQYVAERMGVTQSTYSSWEAGIVDLPLGKLRALGKILGFTVEYTLCPDVPTLTASQEVP
jgi:transcriptional regulator with XRE-family HTH domain